MLELIKPIVLRGIRHGVRLPQAALDRVNELAFLRVLLHQLQIDCVLDVGANRGQFAGELRGIGFAGRIVSFEPVASEFAILRQRFGRDAQWSGHQIALGSQRERKTIAVPRLTVMSSLLPSLQPQPGERHEEIEVHRLDALLPIMVEVPPGARLFLKMDTQGFDLNVFEGAAGCLGAIHGLQSELSVQPLYAGMPHYLQALDCFERAGFELFNLSTVNRIDGGGLLEMNCFMRRRLHPPDSGATAPSAGAEAR